MIVGKSKKEKNDSGVECWRWESQDEQTEWGKEGGVKGTLYLLISFSLT